MRHRLRLLEDADYDLRELKVKKRRQTVTNCEVLIPASKEPKAVEPRVSKEKGDVIGGWKRSLLKHYTTIRKVAGSSLDQVIGFFNLPNPSSCGPGVCSVSNRNEYQKSYWDVQRGRRVRLKLTAICEPII
jgi:hypothetical protein